MRHTYADAVVDNGGIWKLVLDCVAWGINLNLGLI